MSPERGSKGSLQNISAAFRKPGRGLSTPWPEQLSSIVKFAAAFTSHSKYLYLVNKVVRTHLTDGIRNRQVSEEKGSRLQTT